ncbi:MAG TPA: hypothetical protein VGD06_03230 [Acidobacteriota bacterium]
MDRDDPAGAGPLRRVLLAVFLLGALGTLAELILLEHYEDWWQLLPLVLLGASPIAVALLILRPGAASLRSFQMLMLLLVAAGGIGVYQHYSGNVEFELEMYPSRGGFELIWESLKGATPALAPGAVAQLGLLGLAYCFRHPLLARTARDYRKS